jgi:hypothetical protein
MSPVISGKLKQPSTPTSVSTRSSISGLIRTIGIALFGSTSLPLSLSVLGRSSTAETSITVSCNG